MKVPPYELFQIFHTLNEQRAFQSYQYQRPEIVKDLVHFTKLIVIVHFINFRLNGETRRCGEFGVNKGQVGDGIFNVHF